MNNVFIMGRVSQDLNPRYTDSGMCVIRFSVAVQRPKRQGETKAQSDFIDCVAFGKTAEVICNYFHKGDRIVVEGRLQVGSYEKNGQKIRTTDVIVEGFEFVEPPKKKQSQSQGSMEEFGVEELDF